MGVTGISTPRQLLGPLWFRSLQEQVRGRGREATTQLALITLLYLGYRAGRIFAAGQESRAFSNAHALVDFERGMHLPNEASLNAFLTHSDTLARFANGYYASVHFPFAIATLLWLWVYRAQYYTWVRNVMAALTATAVVIHVLVPLAPPRMLPDLGFVDLATRYGQSVYGPPDTDTLSNQFAAMPSLHIGWALLLSIALFLAIRSRWRWAVLAHPVVTTFVVIATANHYWLDGLVATLIMVIAMAFLTSTFPRRNRADTTGGR